MIGYNPNVVEDLKGIQQEEGQRNVIAALVKDLVGLGRHE
jgi:hypothetical protein